MSSATRVTVFHWTDPWSSASGGIDTYIRTFAKLCPADIDTEIVGVTEDPAARPPGRWLELPLGERRVRFHALIATNRLPRRPRVPLSVRYTCLLGLHRVRGSGDVAIVHRPEPALLLGRERAIVFVHHIGPQDVDPARTDFRWARAARVYGRVESRVVRAAKRVHVVRPSAGDYFRETYPDDADKVRCFPTFYDPELFFPAADEDRRRARAALRADLGLPSDARILVTVARLDHQKNHESTVAALETIASRHADVRWLLVGDGVLRNAIRRRIARAGLERRMLMLGAKSQQQIARIHRGADLFVLASAYEGMSIALLEAQAAGLPAVVSDVGEARRTVTDGVTGRVLSSSAPEELANAISAWLEGGRTLAPQECAAAAAPYSARRILPAVAADLHGLRARSSA